MKKVTVSVPQSLVVWIRRGLLVLAGFNAPELLPYLSLFQ